MVPQGLTDPLLTSQPLIVGIGASAGGLEALQEFLSNLPPQHKFAIVIVQHLDPDHDSLLLSLLAKRTASPIKTAEDGMKIEPGHIYLIAPGEVLTIADDTLRTHGFSKPRGMRRPIDEFFESLAINSGSNAVAVVLSGTGSDGANGVRAIKENGGLVFVQDPNQAKYDGMPRAAVETGAHDLVLPVGEMVEVLHDYFDHLSGLKPDHLTDAQFIERAMKHVRYRTGHDFSNYKPATILRRIAVRMSVLGINNPNDYLKRLVDQPSEVSRLFRDVLINVTSFFRDPTTFELLADQVVPQVLGRGEPDREIRIWVPGCSTGQEAYTIGILFAEAIERMDLPHRISIFATDIDDDALRIARAGIYPNSTADEVPDHLLHKYFNWRSEGYEVSPVLRDMVRFSNQSIIKDPPFSRLDLISCRNVLIYFDNKLQDIAMRVFQYGLLEGAYLLLGSSEGPTLLPEYFDEISHRHRLFRRRPGPATRLDLHATGRPAINPLPIEKSTVPQKLDPYGDQLLSSFAPPYVVLSHSDELLFASDSAARFLTLKPGRPKLELTKLITGPLASPVRRLLARKVDPGVVVSQEFQGKLEDEVTRLRISRKVLPDERQLLVFQDHLLPLDTGDDVVDITVQGQPNAYVQELEAELDEARQTIRTTIEELETSNEELKSSNEEMMSMNEELRSSNEELTTTNDELNNKIAEVREINADLENLISSTQIATVFLDKGMRLRSFTPEARDVFRFVTNDTGRRIDDIGADIDIYRLVQECEKVSRTGIVQEAEYQTHDGVRTFKCRIVPYSNEDELTGGVVFTLIDITEVRALAYEAQLQTRLSDARLAEIEELYDISPQAMTLVGSDMKYKRANPRLAEINAIPVEKMLGRRIDEIVPDLDDQVSPVVRSVFATGERIENMRVIGKTARDPHDERVWECDFYPVKVEDEITGVGINVRDVTEHARVSFELRRVMQELQHRVKNMLANVLALVNRSSRDASEDKELFESLSNRIRALAATHTLLSDSNWSSAGLVDLLKPELTRVYGEDRVKMKGPGITVNARAALSLGMAFHEMATNAAKYGSFSEDEGTVSLTWVRQDDGETDAFIFTWREMGGPAPQVGQPDGFGAQLIRSTIEGSLGGTVDMTMTETGLLCQFTIPAESMLEIPEDMIFDVIDP